MRVLVTRPREDCARTADLLTARGHVPVLAPLFDVVALPYDLPPDMSENGFAVLVTSANGLRMVRAHDLPRLRGLPALTVGTATAAQAEALGFTTIRMATGDSVDLARLVRETLPSGTHLLHLAGRHRRDAALQALQHSYPFSTVETYDTVAASALPAMVADGLAAGEVDAVLHFSPRAASVFADLTAQAGVLEAACRVTHVFISAAARDPRLPAGRIATHASLESVVNAL